MSNRLELFKINKMKNQNYTPQETAQFKKDRNKLSRAERAMKKGGFWYFASRGDREQNILTHSLLKIRRYFLAGRRALGGMV